MKKIGFFMAGLLICFHFLNSGSFLYADMDEFKMIPKDAHIVMVFEVNKEDKGIANILNMWKMRFDIKEKFSEKREAIGSLYEQIESLRIVGAVFLPEIVPAQKEIMPADDKDGKLPKYLVVVEIKGEEKQQSFEKALATLLTKRYPLKELEYMNCKINYRDMELEPFHGMKDLSAFVKAENYYLLSSDVNLLKNALDVYAQKVNSLNDNQKFMDFSKNAIEEKDGYIYVNNADSIFEKHLKNWETEQGVTVLLESEFIEFVLFSFNLVDEDAFVGRIVFGSKEGAAAGSIKDDAIFFSQVVERAFVPEGVTWVSTVRLDGSLTNLDFNAAGLKPIWSKALYEKEILKAEETQSISEIQVKSKEELTLKNQLPKIIFVFLMLIIVVAVSLLIARKKT